jgi:hypothetical protein
MKFGWGKKPEDLEKEQQQACVSAPATAGALFTVHLQACEVLPSCSGNDRRPIKEARRGVVQKPSDRAHTTLASTPAARRYRKKRPLLSQMPKADRLKREAVSGT